MVPLVAGDAWVVPSHVHVRLSDEFERLREICLIDLDEVRVVVNVREFVVVHV